MTSLALRIRICTHDLDSFALAAGSPDSDPRLEKTILLARCCFYGTRISAFEHFRVRGHQGESLRRAPTSVFSEKIGHYSIFQSPRATLVSSENSLAKSRVVYSQLTSGLVEIPARHSPASSIVTKGFPTLSVTKHTHAASLLCSHCAYTFKPPYFQ